MAVRPTTIAIEGGAAAPATLAIFNDECFKSKYNFIQRFTGLLYDMGIQEQ